MVLLPMDRGDHARPADKPSLTRVGQHHFSDRIERTVLIVVFLMFLGSIWSLVTVHHLDSTVAQLAPAVARIDHTATDLQREVRISSEVSRGNRVVSCADLDVQAPALAARLPQCAPETQAK